VGVADSTGSDTGATVTIMLDGAIPANTVFRWIACAI
jgi:hypothetical protein